MASTTTSSTSVSPPARLESRVVVFIVFTSHRVIHSPNGSNGSPFGGTNPMLLYSSSFAAYGPEPVLPPVRLFTRLTIGRNSAITMKPTIPPSTITITGSSRLTSPATRTSTSSS